ncbi:MAG: hypothetical protein HQL37_04950 [Alphaproteobacteria bacterium]|nr:hypothetical protein [Alphaproteobacteria bacterium]
MIALLLAGPAQAATADYTGEGLTIVTPPSWIALHQNKTAGAEEVALVPPWQKADAWQDMLMYQEFKNRSGVNPRTVLDGAITEGRKSCPSLLAGTVQEGIVNGYSGAFLSVSCPAQGEINLIKVVAGEKNFYLVQRSWRRPPFSPDKPPLKSTDIDIWVKFLSRLKPCDTRNRAHPCPSP